MTGDFTKQPFCEDNIVCLYNGEIYNYKEFGDYKSDGLCLIDLYKEHGVDPRNYRVDFSKIKKY